MADSEQQHWWHGGAALVTGAAVRVGKAIALRLANLGLDVAVHYRNSREEAEETVREARRCGVRAVALQTDLEEGPDACHGLVEAVSRELSPPCLLVNNASLFESSTLADMTASDWDRMAAVNLKAPAFLCQATAAALESRRGHFIQLGDWRGTTPIPGHFAYTVSKAGLLAMTKLLAQELAPAVQVNAIAPGAILPPPGMEQDFLDKIAKQVPLRRTGSPEQIADAVEYLLHADFITGEVLHLTGGQHLSCQTRGAGDD